MAVGLKGSRWIAAAVACWASGGDTAGESAWYGLVGEPEAGAVQPLRISRCGCSARRGHFPDSFVDIGGGTGGGNDVGDDIVNVSLSVSDQFPIVGRCIHVARSAMLVVGR